MNRYICNLLYIFSNLHFTIQNVLPGPYHPHPRYDVCSSHIYCQGEFLETVQKSKIFSSSKMFVDMKMNRNESDILNEFIVLKQQHNGDIPKNILKNFVLNYFQNDQLDKWIPPDFQDYPIIIDYIKDRNYKGLVSGINQIWKDLARKVSITVNQTKELHSMMYVPNGFFVNVENQEEFYYWDAYWIVRGALICGMEKTVKGMLENFLYLIKKKDYIYAGNKKYYEGRSHPPLLIQMMASYYTFTKDQSFITDNLKFLDKEMGFWLQHRMNEVKYIGNTYWMAHYMNDAFDPRPEMYSIDSEIAASLPSIEDKDEFWCRAKAASESGWGFSSKHFYNRFHYDDLKKTLLKTNPLNFVYVELNAIMQSNANILSQMYLLNNDQANSEFYKHIARRFQTGIDTLLWNEDEKMWLDFDTSEKKSRNYFYASNLAPLWTGSYDEKLSEFYGDAAVDYLIRNNIVNDDLTPRFICIPTSLLNTGLDWDYYNCWPQLQSMVIFGLQSTKSQRAQRVALNFASSWMRTNYVGYERTKTLFEVYNAVTLGNDVTVQIERQRPKGTGVTMGLLLDIMNTWGDVLTSTDNP